MQISIDCWRAAQDEDTESKADWLAKKRVAEQAEAEEWSTRYRMPPLEGTDRAITWGTRCRHQLMAAAYTALVVEGTTGEAEWAAIEDAARPLTRAGWWLDQVRHEAPRNRVEVEGLHRRPVAAGW
ncbi:hypothetical protein [Streptomyces sp. 900105755]